jgi:hypothetical protein
MSASGGKNGKWLSESNSAGLAYVSTSFQICFLLYKLGNKIHTVQSQ